MTEEAYNSWSALAQAIKAAASRARADRATSRDVSALIAGAVQDRFLSRVFAAGDQSEWLLKGGGAMLARVPTTRSTKDIDLAAAGSDLDEAQRALQDVARHELGDHLRFELTAIRETGRGDNQPGVQTRRLLFSCLDAQTGRKVAVVPVDIVVGPPPIGRIETVTPANRLTLPRDLPAAPYRLFPVADQIAEKVCATLQHYGGMRSTRVKDLVDLVTIARTQRVDLRELHAAIEQKRRHSRMDPIQRFTIPDGWERTYRVLAAATASTGGITSAADAEALVAQLVDPALTGDGERTWIPSHGWSEPGQHPSADLTSREDQPVHVAGHVRAGRPVTEHQRRRRNDST